jgi:hypothetical protein
MLQGRSLRQPQATSTKLCRHGAINSSWNNIIAKVLNDGAQNRSTAMSSKKRVCQGRNLSYWSRYGRGTLRRDVFNYPTSGPKIVRLKTNV